MRHPSQPHTSSTLLGQRNRADTSSSDSDDSVRKTGKGDAVAKKKNPLAGLAPCQNQVHQCSRPDNGNDGYRGRGEKKKRGPRPADKLNPRVPSSLKSGTPTLGDWETSATLSPSRKNSTGSNNTTSSLSMTTDVKKTLPSVAKAATPNEASEEPVKKKRGRPKGSKNKPKGPAAISVARAAAEAEAASYNTAEDTDREDEPNPKKRK